MIIVMGYLSVTPSLLKEYIVDVVDINPSTTKVEGCLFYSVTIDHNMEGRIAVAEQWENEEALSNHLKSKNVANFMQKWSTHIQGEVTKFDASNPKSL